MNKGLIYSACIKGNAFRHCFISFPHHWRAYISPASVPTFLVASESHSLVVSWAGHTHDQESEDEVHVYISTKLLQVNGFTDGEPVMIRQVSCPAPCSNASIVVIRDSDWDELMLNIQVAQNAFLTQLRVIKKDQIFPLWLEGGVYIFMKVISFSPSTAVSLLQPNTEVKVLPPSENVVSDVPLSLKPAISENFEIIQKTKEQNMLQLIYYIFILLGYSLNKLRLFPKEELSVKLKIVDLPLKYFDCCLHILPKLLMMHPSLVLISWKNLRNTKYESSEYFIAKIYNNCLDKKSKNKDNYSSETCLAVVVVWEKLIKRIRIEPYFRDIDRILQHKTCISSKNLYKKMTANKDVTVFLETLESPFISSKNFILDVTVKDPTHVNCSVISTTLFSNFAELNQYCPIVINNKTVLTLDLDGEHRDIFLCTRDDHPVIVKTMKGSPLYFHIDLSLSKQFPYYNSVDEKWDSFISRSDNHVNEEIFQILCSSLESDIYLENHVFPNFSLLQGSRSSGKTTLANKLIKRFSVYPYFVYCKIISFKILKGKKVDSVQKLLKESLSDVLAFRPSLLILDDIDCISNKKSSEDNGPLLTYTNHLAYMVRTLLNQLIEVLKVTAKTLSSNEAPVIVIATCVSRNDVHSFLTSPKGNHIFPRSFHISPLSEFDKLSILQYYLESRRKSFIAEKSILSTCKIPQEKMLSCCNENLISKLDSMTLLDIKNISLRAFNEAKERWLYAGNFVDKYSDFPYLYENSDVEKALNGYISSSMKAFCLQSKIEQQNRIGGLHEPRQMLEEMILWPLKYPKIFSQTSLRLRSGILLYGPPGCGKSLLAKSFISYHINFITIKGPELLSKYIGQSEKAVRDAFERASSAKPCILFFDEFESIAPRRGHDNTGVTDRVVNQLLTQMDGVEGLSGVFILAATSRPELIDPALLRPGRLDKGVYCPIPNSSDREEILKVLCEDINLDPAVNIKEIAAKTEGYSGADLKNILSTALIKSAQSSIGKFFSKNINDLDTNLNEDINNLDHENISVDESIRNSIYETSPYIRMEDIYDALAQVKPSVGVKERLRYDELYKRFSQSKKGYSFTQIIPGKRETLA